MDPMSDGRIDESARAQCPSSRRERTFTSALRISWVVQICLELAYRHPDSFAGIIACEACDKINQRQTIWAAHPHVNQAQFVPEWIRALSAPQSPAEYVEQIAWHYGQGGPQVFFGDIAFYSGVVKTTGDGLLEEARFEPSV